jgi:hypothetical protein
MGPTIKIVKKGLEKKLLGKHLHLFKKKERKGLLSHEQNHNENAGAKPNGNIQLQCS